MAKKKAKKKSGEKSNKAGKSKLKEKGKKGKKAKDDDKTRKSAGKRWVAESKEFGRTIGVAILLAFVIRFFVVEAFKIPSGSMLPTLEVGDHIFVNKFIYGFMIPLTTTKILQLGEPQTGDVIVFKYPRDTSQDYIKRVVGTPGDHVEVVGGVLYVNGERQEVHVEDEHAYVMERDCNALPGVLGTEQLGDVSHSVFDTGYTSNDDFSEIEVPEGHVFVMGDNRDHSLDGREWGYVPYGNIKGKAMFIWLSWNRCSNQCPPEIEDCGGTIRWNRLFRAVH